MRFLQTGHPARTSNIEMSLLAASLKQVLKTIGHSSISVTADVYGHFLAPSTATADAMAHVMYGI